MGTESVAIHKNTATGLFLQILQNLLQSIAAAKGGSDGPDGIAAHQHGAAFFQIGKIPQCLCGLKAQDEFRATERNRRCTGPLSDADLARHRAAALRHANGF